MDVQGLWLIDEGTPPNSQVYDFFLADFPHRFEEIFSLLGDFLDPLHWAIGGDQFVSDLGCPQVLLNQVVD